MTEETIVSKAYLEAYVDRTLVPAEQTAQRFALLLLHAPEAGEGAVHPLLNLSLVIDRSGSMSGPKLEFVKDAASHALRLLHDADRASLVIYDDEIQVLAPARPVTPRHRDEMLRQLRGVRSGGSTDLYGGWEAGCGQVRDGQTSDFINRVLLLTDGLANVGTTDHEAIVTGIKAQRRAGISTTAFGVGDDFNQFLLQGMADNGGGHFYFIGEPSQIPAFFGSELGEMLTVTARDLALEIVVPEGLTIDLLNDLPNAMADGVLRIELGEASAGEVRTLALRLGLSPSQLHSEWRLPLRVSYADAAGQPVVIEGQGVTFLVMPVSACEEQPVNELVLSETGRMLAERAKMQALALLHRDDRTAAAGVLREAIATVQKLLPEHLAAPLIRELQELLRRTEDQPLTAREAKMAHYYSYMVQRSRKQ